LHPKSNNCGWYLFLPGSLLIPLTHATGWGPLSSQKTKRESDPVPLIQDTSSVVTSNEKRSLPSQAIKHTKSLPVGIHHASPSTISSSHLA
jgi:hypothetical protein